MNEKMLRKKMLASLLGKAAGGTLGAPWEACNGPMNLTFYDPVPTDMLPNDDVDLQILWGCHLATDWKGIVAGNNFAKAWSKNIDFPFDEYGVAIRNVKRGIPFPWTGKVDNWFVNGLGSAIRSEIWAYLFPGEPEKAAECARIDASLDHDGDGVHAEVFLSVLESMAFLENDLHLLIEKALKYLPDGSILKSAIRETVLWCSETQDHAEIRSRIMRKYGSDNFTDVRMNLPFMVAALILGKGNFGKSICTAVNFGQDTDCTGATVGAICGLLSPDSLDSKWLKPIGRKLVLSKEITGIKPPETLDGFIDLLCSLRDKIIIRDDTVKKFDPAKFRIPCKQGIFPNWFTRDYRKFSPVLPAKAKATKLPGNCFTVDTAKLPVDSLLMTEIEFEVPANRTYKVLVSTHAEMRTWVDGKFVFGQVTGPMLPAFHRAAINQLADVSLKAGKHKLLIGIAPRAGFAGPEEVFFGIAEMNKQWVVC